ncbi:hypothetical protein AVEN_125982-1 [Araneus ventricosus]|uniref:Uncharacterized protein n=1 Tax=Araneus ventricosus TaxID=182803 RepID=A0A4Y2SUA2_ARAVE|nr:hypothetical protein AVEN_125982-1 [Araneus ventricosus]
MIRCGLRCTLRGSLIRASTKSGDPEVPELPSAREYILASKLSQSSTFGGPVFDHKNCPFSPSMRDSNLFHNTLLSIDEPREYLFSEEIETIIIAIPRGLGELADQKDFDDERTTIPAIFDSRSKRFDDGRTAIPAISYSRSKKF